MNLLITGGAGFIGSHLCEAVLEKDHSVICIDDFNDYYSPKIKEKNIEGCLKSKRFELFREDISDHNSIKKIFERKKIDQVIHIAARAGVRESISNPLLFEQVNVKGTLNLLQLCMEFNIKKFIFTSSSSVYGNNKKIPFSETDTTDNIISHYAATKRSAEIFCEVYSRLYGIKITCLRLFTVYGPRGRPEMAPYKFTKLIYGEKEVPIFGDGNSKRDYTYISDIIDGIVSTIDKDFKFEIINLGNSKPIELRKFISIIENTVGKKAKIKKLPHQKGDVSITFADISKAKELLNYSPKVDLDWHCCLSWLLSLI